MHVAVLLYPGCVFFEVALAVETLAEHCTIGYYTPDGNPHRASNQAILSASGDVQALQAAQARAVLVPGGDPHSILVPTDCASPALRAQAERGALIAGICAGNLVMAAAGLLKGRRGTHNYTTEHAAAETVAAVAHNWIGMTFERCNLVRDGRVITAQPWAYRQYAGEVARALGVLTDESAHGLEHYVRQRSYDGG